MARSSRLDDPLLEFIAQLVARALAHELRLPNAADSDQDEAHHAKDDGGNLQPLLD
jgi:hypothetical protein